MVADVTGARGPNKDAMSTTTFHAGRLRTPGYFRVIGAKPERDCVQIQCFYRGKRFAFVRVYRDMIPALERAITLSRQWARSLCGTFDTPCGSRLQIWATPAGVALRRFNRDGALRDNFTLVGEELEGLARAIRFLNTQQKGAALAAE